MEEHLLREPDELEGDEPEVLTLKYHPVAMVFELRDPILTASLHAALRVANPDYPHPQNPNVPPFIEFSNPASHAILTGLLPAVLAWADEWGLRVEREGWPDLKVRRKPAPDLIPGITLEDYQVSAVEECLKHQRGVLEIATAGGKTEVAIGLVLALGKPRTLYVVPDLQSMHQILGRFRTRGVQKRFLGLVGDDVSDPDARIVIACIASVYAALRRGDGGVLRLLEEARVLFLDEVHHEGTAFTWQVVAAACLAPVRIGMSGTPYKDNLSRFNPRFIHPHDSYLTGYTGPTLVYLPPWCLQEVGKLAPCEVHPFPGGGPRIRVYDWATVYREGVVENEVRNRRMLNLIANLVDGGGRPLVSVGTLEHGRTLQRALLDMGVIAACSYGSGVLIVPSAVAERLQAADSKLELTPVPVYEPEEEHDDVKDGRRKRPKRKVIGEEDDFLHIPASVSVNTLLLDGSIQVVIGSKIYDEALDVPCLTDLVNVGGGKASQRHRQKIGRILRLFEGKRMARIWDPWDECHVFLRKQSEERMRIAREEGYAVIVRPAVECFFRIRDVRVTKRHVVEGESMKVKEIYLEASLTIPVGNYNSLKPTVGLKAEVEPGESVEVAFEKLQKQVMLLFMNETLHLATADQDLMINGAHLGGVVNAALAFLQKMMPPEAVKAQ